MFWVFIKMIDLKGDDWDSANNDLIGKSITKNDEVRRLKTVLKDCLGLFLQGHQKECVSDLVVSEDNKFIASGCADWSVRVWSLDGCKQVAEFSDFTSRIRGVCFGNKDQFLLAGCEDGKIFVMELWKGEIFGVLKFGKLPVILMSEIRGTFRIAALYQDGVVIIWNYLELTTAAKFNRKRYLSLSINFVDNSIFLIDSNFQMDIINSNTLEPIRSLDLKEQIQFTSKYESIQPIKNSPKFILNFKDQNPESYLLVSNHFNVIAQSSVNLIDILCSASSSTSEIVYTSSKTKGIQKLYPSQNLLQDFIQNKYIYTSINIDNNQESLILGTNKGIIEIRDIESGVLKQKTPNLHSYISGLYINPSTSHLLTADSSNRLKLWNLKTTKIDFQTKLKEKITCSALSKSSHLIACNTKSGSLFISSWRPPLNSVQLDKIQASSLLFTNSSLLILKTSTQKPSIHIYKTPAHLLQ